MSYEVYNTQVTIKIKRNCGFLI